MSTCKQCGVEIIKPCRPTQKYCSNRCRKRAHCECVKRWNLANREKIVAYKLANRELHRAQYAAYYRRTDYYRQHRDRIIVYQKARREKEMAEINERYVRHYMRRNFARTHGISADQIHIPPEMIAAVKQILRVKRQLQEMRT